ncbi:LPXTG cell wall anchor domain-containing protein [Facklamia miroungae]|nr:LPXTG cell wall anchor domain-containing protein [Facklamia miroungae]
MTAAMTQTAFAETFSLDIQNDKGEVVHSVFHEAEEASNAERFFKNFVNEQELGNFDWAFNAESGKFVATPIVEEESTTTTIVEEKLYTYKLVVKTADTNITSEYDAKSMQAAEQYFYNYVEGQGLKGLNWSYDFDTMTFMATDEEPAELFTYKLVVKTADTNITSEYDAANKEAAEEYFHAYVARNGLGELNWTYDAETKTFMVTDSVETTKEETTTTKEETTKEETTKEETTTTKENKPADKKDSKDELPQTGDSSAFAIYGAAALSVLAGLGLVAKKREEA